MPSHDDHDDEDVVDAFILLPRHCITHSVTRKISPNVYKRCPKMISLEKLKILTPLQKLPKNVGDSGKLIVTKSPINHPIWSH